MITTTKYPAYKYVIERNIGLGKSGNENYKLYLFNNKKSRLSNHPVFYLNRI
jgi:hypothetical protein